jgi:hypothetical protein
MLLAVPPAMKSSALWTRFSSAGNCSHLEVVTRLMRIGHVRLKNSQPERSK